MTHDELRALCDRIINLQNARIDAHIATKAAKGCLSMLNEMEQLQEDVKAWITHVRRADDNEQRLEAQLQTTREASEPLIRQLNQADQAKQVDKHIGLTPDDWTTWVYVGDLRRLKEVFEGIKDE